MKTKIHFFKPSDQNEAGNVLRSWHRLTSLLSDTDFWYGFAFLVILLLLFVTRGDFSIPSYKLGDIASATIRAPQDIQVTDSATTDRKRKEAQERVLPVYDFEPDLANTAISRMHDIFTYVRQRQEAEQNKLKPAGLAADITKQFNIDVDPKVLSEMVQPDLSQQLENSSLQKLRKIMSTYLISDRKLLFLYASKGLVIRTPEMDREERMDASSVQDVHGAEEALRVEFEKDSTLNPSLATAHTEFLVNFVVPTIYLNSSETQSRLSAAARNMEPVFYQIKKGKVIVRDGEEVTSTVQSLLQAVKSSEPKGVPIRYSIGIILLLVIYLIALKKYLTVHKVSDIKLRDKRLFPLCGAVLVANMALVKLGLVMSSSLSSVFLSAPFNSTFAYQTAIPFAAGALLLTLLTDRQIATIYSFGFAILIGVVTRGDFYLGFYCLASGIAAANSVKRYYQRSTLLRSGLWIWFANILTVFTIFLLQESGLTWSGMLFHAGCAFASAVFSSAVASVFSPFLEWLFNITTDIKLLELSNLDLPVLRQLALEAPGTYHHSIVMGTIAEAAAEKVGANPLFLRVSALYHDIGKIRKSEYYVENQRELNKHDTLNPRMSALVIINHVKEGLEVARMLRLPSDVAAMIPQHHGTRLITYFYKKAKDLENPEVEKVREEDYRYPGPKPQSKEGAILMLADATEAASRTLTEPSPARLKNMVHTIFRAIFEDGQLDESNLTMKDLTQIAEAFIRKLESVFHHRVNYPGFEFNKDDKRQDSGQSEDLSEKMAN